MKKIIFALGAIAFCFCAGLSLWPYVHSAYERIFPEPDYVSGNYTAILKQAGKPVVMFSTSTCPYCEHTREYLREAQVDFEDFIVDQSPEAEEQFKALGGIGVPLLFIGDRRIVGFREDTLRESLALVHH